MLNAEQVIKLAEIVYKLSVKVVCPICLEHINKWAELECQHKFCNACISKHKSNSAFICPICKRHYSRRAHFFKDEFGEQLSKFVDKSYQLIKEKYALDAKELLSNKDNLHNLIDTAPQDVHGKEALQEYFSKIGRSDVKGSSTKILNFKNDASRDRILAWLNDNRTKLGVLTENNSNRGNSSDEEFKMASISQVAKKKRKSSKQRSQSWTEPENLPGPLIKKYHSLAEGLNEADNYNIEDDYSEKVVKQVERRVIQDMLEEECLANLEQAAQLVESETKKKPEKKSKSKSTSSEKLLNTSNSSSGWKRANSIKSAIKKCTKERKSLNIVTCQTGDKTSPKRISPRRTSPRDTLRKKKPSSTIIKSAGKVDKKLPEKNLKETVVPKSTPPKIKASLNQSISSMDFTIVEETAIPCKQATSPEKLEEDIFNCPTQRTPHTISPHIGPVHVPPIPPDLISIPSIALELNKNINSCISSTNDSDLINCFTNLQTYVDKILEIRNKKSVNVLTQTVDVSKSSVEVQTVRSEEDKSVQASQVVRSAYAQTEEVHEEVLRSFNPNSEGRKSQRKRSQKASTSSSSNKTKNISQLVTKPSKSTETPNILSASSMLVFSLDPSEKTQKTVSRKLSYGESEGTRNFKRIRAPASDSDSDEDHGNPSKKKFVKDDLTVDFIETEKPSTENSLQESEDMDYDKYLLEAMEKYDPSPPKKLFETPPASKKKSQKQKLITQVEQDDHIFTASADFQANFDKFDQDIMEFEKNSKSYSTELDMVENTPGAEGPVKMPRLPHKTRPFVPLRILSRNSADNNSKTLTQESLNSVLNGSIHIESNANDVAELLEDLRNDEDFFKSPLETQALSHKTQHDVLTHDATMTGLNENKSETAREVQEKMPEVTNKVKILQNIKLNNVLEDEIIDSSEDEAIVEGTPQKYKPKSNESLTSLTDILNKLASQLDDNLDSQDKLDMCLPPPPGFGDEETVGNDKENHSPQKILSPNQYCGLTEFIVTPEDSVAAINNEEPKKTLNKSLQMLEASESMEDNFSPIAKCSRKITQSRYTPLKTTPRPSPLRKPNSLMTSTPKQKSILNFVVPNSQQSLPTRRKLPCIMWSRIFNKDLNVFTKMECRKLISTSKVFTKEVTHLVVTVDEKGQMLSSPTAKILQAIAAGLWVVRYEWIVDSLNMGKLVPEDPYEALTNTGASVPKFARLNREKDPLFKNFKFYCCPPYENLSKAEVESILRLSGGEVATDLGEMMQNDGKVHIILGETFSTEDTDRFSTWLEIYNAVTVDIEWLSRCVIEYKLVSFRPFLLSGQENVSGKMGYPLVLMESVPLTMTEQM